jgi:phosphoribosylamine--glycine ligase/phosphoribosylformylglycinamidine cyclo-ligase
MVFPKKPLRILILGSGGREHALSWKLSQSDHVEAIFCVPGNAGTGQLPKTTNIKHLNESDLVDIIQYAHQEKIDMLLPGPEAPLVAGVADLCHRAGIACFGPSMEAARLEGSKAFSKDFMHRHHIPTSQYKVFTELESAIAYVQTCPHKVVLKASGLAAGKGVLLPNTLEETIQGLNQLMVEKVFGEAANGADLHCLQNNIVLCFYYPNIPV